MSSLREALNDHKYLKFSLLIGANAALLYALYFIIKNFDLIWLNFWGGLGKIVAALAPLWVGLIIAYVIHPLVKLVDKGLSKLSFKFPDNLPLSNKFTKGRRLLSIILTLLLILTLVSALIYGLSVLILGDLMVDGIGAAINSIIDYVKSYENVLQEWANKLPEGELSSKLQDLAQGAVNWFAENLHLDSMVNFIMSLGGGILNFALGLVVSIYLLYDRELFLAFANRFVCLLVPSSISSVFWETLRDINKVLSSFIRGASIDAVIVGILSSIALSILGLEFSVFIGFFAGISNIIPYFGPILGAIPAFIVGTFTQGIWQGVFAVIILIGIQQIDANLIYPKVVGSQTGLHPLFVLLSVAFAAHFGGIIGMILAVPAAGILRVLVIRWSQGFESRREKKAEKNRPST
ncbi:MAG: AI-2E family transporter [Anaerovoracaceae bacterium]|jgi:predicted PurR-regulated permease PerM|nr:AI-2E family transporter [Anaerovoracaceae bacterium]